MNYSLTPAQQLIAVLSLAQLFPLLSACSGSSASDVRSDDTAYAYVADGPYASVLKPCVFVGSVADSCALSTLPFIGQRIDVPAQTDNRVEARIQNRFQPKAMNKYQGSATGNSTIAPSTEQILEHVLVTHAWMGQRFAQLLDSFPEDIRLLLGSVTAIYIGSKVRPSYYSTLNGAIHLDPDQLWLTNAEKATISKEQDYRSDYGAALRFDFYRRFVNNGTDAWPARSLLNDSERALADIRLPLARLLYHELAHANDFMPMSERAALDSMQSVYAAIDSVRSAWRAPLLDTDYPLKSTQLKALAKVRYRGETATPEQIRINADYAGALLEQDGSVYFYGYSSKVEELSGLFVAALMKYHFAVSIDVAFVDKPAGTVSSGCALPIGWGRHNWLANPLVAAKARYAVTLLLGNEMTEAGSDFDRFMHEQLGRELALPQGVDWCASWLN